MNRCFIFLLFLFSAAFPKHYDVTLMGRVIQADGLCRMPITIAQMVKDHLKVNFTLSDRYVMDNVPPEVQRIMLKEDKNQVGNVLLYTDALWQVGWNPTVRMPKTKLHIAYSMLESTQIPQKWVEILNTKFDMVVVPDKFLVDVYKSSGVKIPLFVLPIGLNLDDFLYRPLKQAQNYPFIFGMTAGFVPGKNHELVLEGFIRAFGNNPKVKLLIHGRWGEPHIINRLYDIVNQYKTTNVEIIQKVFSHQEYIAFMTKLDCYVLISQGEGFSITPREALALGIPCVISDKTAHATICETHLVTAVPCNTPEKAKYSHLGTYDCGYKYVCKVEDLAQALLKNYHEYNHYLSLAKDARSWAAQYSYKNLAPWYRSMLKPKKVLLGSCNQITPDYVMTDSKKLYNKYQDLLK